MKNLKIKTATIARIGALVVTLINQCLAIFGKGSLPFTENMVYQIISLILTAAVTAVNCWYNQDITKIALITGKIFDALNDGKITEEELESILEYAESEESSEPDGNTSFLIGFANGVIKNLQGDKKNSGNSCQK
jgi:SPP1 family holin